MARRQTTTEELLAALRDVAEGYDGVLTTTAYAARRRPEHPGVSTVSQRFDSWSDALVAAGLEPTLVTHRRWTTENALPLLQAWLEGGDHSSAGYAAAARADRSLPPPPAITRVFGGWRKALAAAGVSSSSSEAQ